MHGPLAARLSLDVEQGPQGMQASVVAARGLQGSGSGVLVHELGEPQHVDLPALARDGVSREVPCSALKGETVPDSLPVSK